MELKKDTIITLTDENGRPVEFDLLMVFDHDGKKYSAMMPLDQVEGVGEDEIVIFEIRRNGLEEIFAPVESPVMLEEVFREFEELYEDQLDKEEEGNLTD